MKLLVVTAWYHPFIHPRAYRWTEITAQWVKDGHEVQVVTAKIRESNQPENFQGVRVHRVGFDSLKELIYNILPLKSRRGRVGAIPRKPGQMEGLLNWCYQHIWKQMYFPDDACIWYFPAKRKILQLMEEQQFDAVVTVSLPFTGHLLGLAVKKKFPALTWLADIGDPFSIQAKPPNNPRFFSRLNNRLENKVLRTADRVTLTTASLLREYQRVFHLPDLRQMSIIPPLMSRTPEHSLTAEPLPGGLHLGYFGALYAPTRTPGALLDLLDRMIQRKPEAGKTLLLHFWGDIFPQFYDEIASRPYTRMHGLQSRDEVWRHMRQVDVLVSIGNITGFQLPGKTVDYLAAQKPVLHLSYLDNDPFSEIMGDSPLVFVLRLKDGKVLEQDLNGCMHWLSDLPEPGNMPDLQAFTAVNISSAYLATILSVNNSSRMAR